MADKKTKKADRFIMCDVGVELKAIIAKVAKSQSKKSISQWIREASEEKLSRDGIAV